MGPARARGWLRRDATVAFHAVRTMIVNGEPAFGVLVERTSGVPALDLPAQRARLTTRLPECGLDPVSWTVWLRWLSLSLFSAFHGTIMNRTGIVGDRIR